MTDVNGVKVEVGDDVLCNFIHLWNAKVVDIGDYYVTVRPGPMGYEVMSITQNEFEVIERVKNESNNLLSVL